MFASLDEISAYTGLKRKTFEIQLERTFEQMRRMGADLSGKPRATATYLWVTYWLTEEAKASLRNVRLTGPTLA